MATKLNKKVERETFTWFQRGQVMVALLPGDLIEFRQKGKRKRFVLPIDAAFSVAVKMEVAAQKKAKVEARKAKRGTK